MSGTQDDDAFLFADEPEPAADAGQPTAPTPVWTVLVVDDSDFMHQVTRIALADLRPDGAPVLLLHAYSAVEARTVLAAHPECALVLLDVVMETDDAGLVFADWVRDTLGNHNVRIILRTGQPGMAPEQSVMERYDIHDYQSKTDVSAQRLRTSITGGLRAYRDLRALTLQRQGLEKVIDATASLFAPKTLHQLLSGILDQVVALLVPREHAVFFLARAPLFSGSAPGPEPEVLVASGRFSMHAGSRISEVWGAEAAAQIEGAARPGSWTFVGDDGLFGFDVGEEALPALFVSGARSLGDWDRQTIALFCASAAMALRNQRLYTEREALLEAFGRFVPHAFIELLGKADVRTLVIGDQTVREVAVCFFDVEGFTARSEALGPARVFALLNRIYGAIGPIISQHGGLIDKYMGDGVMVLFPDGPAAAVAAAVAIQHAMAALNAQPELAARPVVLRSSMEFGPVILGTVGHAGRFDTTVVADVVNVAARLQGWCRALGTPVLVTDRCQAGVAGVLARELGPLDLRGRAAPVICFEVFEADPEPLRRQKVAALDAFASAVEHRRHGRWLESVGALRDALDRSPDDAVARWMLADSAQRLVEQGARG